MPSIWDASRRARASLEAAPVTFVACSEYVRRYPRHAPDFFTYTSRDRRAKVSRAFRDSVGWAARLALSVDEIGHFTMHAEHLNLAPEDADPSRIFDLETVRRWKKAVMTSFQGPVYWKLEAGSRLHVHVVADLSDGPSTVRRGSECAKPCAHYLEQLVAYLGKPPLEYAAESLFAYLSARRRLRRLPQLSGAAHLPRSITPKATDRISVASGNLRNNLYASGPKTTAPQPAETTAPKSPPRKVKLEIRSGGSLTTEIRPHDRPAPHRGPSGCAAHRPKPDRPATPRPRFLGASK